MLLALMAAAFTASWTPLSAFTLSCTGTVSSYQDGGSGTLSLPWSDTFAVDLVNGVYCEAACTTPTPIAAVDDAGITLQTATSPTSSTQAQYTASSNAIEIDTTLATAPGVNLHTAESGTCTLSQSPTPSSPPASPSS